MSQFPGINQLRKNEESGEPPLNTEFLTEDARKINSAIAESLQNVGDVTEEALRAALPGRFIRAINLEYLAELFRNGPVLTIRIWFPGIFSNFFAEDIRERVSERTPILEEDGSTVITVFVNKMDSARMANNISDYIELIKKSNIMSSNQNIGICLYLNRQPEIVELAAHSRTSHSTLLNDELIDEMGKIRIYPSYRDAHSRLPQSTYHVISSKPLQATVQIPQNEHTIKIDTSVNNYEKYYLENKNEEKKKKKKGSEMADWGDMY